MPLYKPEAPENLSQTASEGFLYLAAVLDWNSRYVLSWQLSNTLGVGFCLWTLADALCVAPAPYIFNYD